MEIEEHTRHMRRQLLFADSDRPVLTLHDAKSPAARAAYCALYGPIPKRWYVNSPEAGPLSSCSPAEAGRALVEHAGVGGAIAARWPK